MPVHWYYNVRALDHDYGEISGYQAPKNPHPDSILWRSEYKPVGSNADILHGQKKFWGRRNIHYHQHLQAGENTLNLQLELQTIPKDLNPTLSSQVHCPAPSPSAVAAFAPP